MTLNEVRLIDLFVGSLDLADYGFKTEFIENGRPSYHPSDFELIGGKLIAGDSAKLRAQNSKKNNFNEKKIERHIAYIDAKLDEYAEVLAAE